MKKIFKNKLTAAAFVLSAAWLIWYFALGAAIFKNMWYTSPAIPLTGGVAALLPLSAVLLNNFVFKKRWVEIVIICLCPALMFAHFVLFAFVLSKLVYFFVAGKPYFITIGLAALIAFFVFAFPRLDKLFRRISAITLAAVVAIICLICLFNAVPFYISGGTTVFVVENEGAQEYQIAFATSVQSTGEVTVNGKTYYDQTNGENNVCKLHKISVPADELDEAKSYSIGTQCVALNTAYLPTKGTIIRKSYSFRPVDDTDGLQIYNLSDTHECIAGPANAADYFGDKLDLLILNGDIINDASTQYQISLIYKLAHRITGGTRPVLFTRGNHECNGYYAADLGKYVGCAERGFYFNLKLGSLSMLVLDTNNDMADGNALINPVANFNQTRAEQSEWLKALGDWSEGSEYGFVIAHMAYPLSGYQAASCSWHGWARELVELTEGKTRLALCGHSHKTDYIEPGDPDNAKASYPVLRGSIRSNKYPDKEGISPLEFTGTALEIKDGKVMIKFTNANKKVLAEHVLEV
ncbi:MAG: metallophosphoesterase [Clostridia bacterium]|nr:metallophosphoesterase [Clostridia bacterium]